MVNELQDIYVSINKEKKIATISSCYPEYNKQYTMTYLEINKCWQWSYNDWKDWIRAKNINLI